MSNDIWQGEVSILGMDIKSYSLKTEKGLKDAQDLLDRLLKDAVSATAKIDDVDWLDGGDGGFLLIRGDTLAPMDVLATFERALSAENEKLLADSRVSIRYALHCGSVYRWGGPYGLKFASAAVNVAARLLNGMSKDYDGQVVISGAYRAKVTAYGGIDDRMFERMPNIRDKHGQPHEVWNAHQSPGFGVTLKPEHRHPT